MNIVFRVDASSVMGTGHVMRCLTLADALGASGANCRFLCREHPGNLVERIRGRSYPVETLALSGKRDADLFHSHWLGATQEEDAAACVALLAQNAPADWLIVDHYALDERWEKALRPHGRNTMVIDDLADRRHDCDLLLDQNLVANGARRYDALLPESCGRMLGPRYALLQPRYAELHDRIPPREGEIHRILVYFGGVDAHDLSGMAVDAFLSLENPEIALDLVIHPTVPHAAALHEKAARHSNVTLHENLPGLAPLMAKADLAIGACGATSWERCCLGLPALVVTLAENQRPIARELHARGLIHWLGDASEITLETLSQALKESLSQGLPAMSEACRALVDGGGGERVANILTINRKTPLVARPAEWKDEDLLLEWANDPLVRKHSFQPEAIDRNTHRKWFRERLREFEQSKLYIVETESGFPVGQARFDRLGEEWEMDYSLDARLRQRHLGRPLLRTALLKFRQETPVPLILARVKENNPESRRLLESLGFDSKNQSFGGWGVLFIAICSDAASWMNAEIPDLLLAWWAMGHRVAWGHEARDLPGGDICFYLGYGKIVDRMTRARYNHNLVAHESALPEGRGWSPMTWRILAGESQFTVSLFEAVDEVDAGPIYLQETFHLQGAELVFEWRALQAETTRKLCRAFVSEYPAVLNRARRQEGEGSAYPRRTPKDSRLDVDRPLKEQFNLLRVVDNERYPAYFEIAGGVFTLHIQKMPITWLPR
ncbi:MAG: UDP-2,4-diacetamido-2,4,6-trideoxy-beta-L-altropyranose hydrolase [Zoogloeaceae bacterium]|jgi:UDP-2,4-diacetamido-2,4,6-trideoxy-beta-L-altropyranose hydrolase|nr:UDP-2,4-diacetamido-2,4,6-trideoxy-beta-L-altropyranose hydrolase [Zoogloeaceae bacterium]